MRADKVTVALTAMLVMLALATATYNIVRNTQYVMGVALAAIDDYDARVAAVGRAQ